MSIFYPFSSVGKIITFDVVEDTDSNLPSDVCFMKTLARESLKIYLPGSPGIKPKRVGQRTAVYGGTDGPKIQSFTGGGVFRGVPWAGYSIDLLHL